jgi:cysteine desulfuration protein SufE
MSPALPTIAPRLAELQEDFELLGDWESQIQHVIDLGRELEPLSEAEHSEANRVRGCASQVWLVTARDGEALSFRGDSDSPLVKGLIAVLVRLYSGAPAAEILAFDVKAAFAKLGLAGALTAQRSNGLASMVARIRDMAAVVAA